MMMKLLLATILTVASLCGTGAEETPKEILQQALFAEEAEGDLDGAADGYEKLITDYDAQREFAVAALYRLAEVRRKQERNDDAAKLYQRILAEFPDADPQARLSRENLTAMGIAPPAGNAAAPPDPKEVAMMRRLMMLRDNKPDKVWDQVRWRNINSGGWQDISPLTYAARRGWIRLIDWLLDDAATQGRDISEALGDALVGAVYSGQLEACKRLHAGGAKIETVSRGLVDAICLNRDTIAEWLIAEGIDANSIGDGYLPSIYPGSDKHYRYLAGAVVEGGLRLKCDLTPLAAAIATDNKPWVDRLLEMKVDVDAVGEKERRMSALATACLYRHGPLVKRLLDFGANPNLADELSEYKAATVRNPATRGARWTPLHYGAGNATIVEALLAAGADPSIADSLGVTPLHVACHAGNIESAEKLIAAGAKADVFGTFLSNKINRGDEHPFEANPLMLASLLLDSEKSWAMIELLIEHGADPLAENSSGQSTLSVCDIADTCRRLVDTYVYPKVATLEGIAISVPECGVTRIFPAPPGGESETPLFSDAMLLWSDVDVRKAYHEFEWREFDWAHPVLRRLQKDGGFSAQTVDVLKESGYPMLQWGDIIEIPLKLSQSPSKRSATALSRILQGGEPVVEQARIPAAIRGVLRAQRTAEITLVLPGEERLPIRLKGGLVSVTPFGPFDAGKLGSCGIPLRSGRGMHWDSSATVEREGQSPISLAPKEVYNFVPEAGDVITWSGDLEQTFRREVVNLVEPREKFSITTADGSRRHGLAFAPGSKPVRPKFENLAELPTLFQLIAKGYAAGPVQEDILQIWNGSKARDEFLDAQKLHLVAEFGEGKAGTTEEHRPDAASLSEALAAFARVENRRDVVLPHPDFSTITIRRLLEDGSEKLIEVPLGDFIAGCTDETPAEECHAKDVELQLGDVVELKAHYDRLDTPWKGFTTEEARFLSKALSYRVEIENGDKGRQSLALVWTAPRIFDTNAGIIVVPGDERAPVNYRADNVAKVVGGRPDVGGWIRDGAVFPRYLQAVSPTRSNKPRSSPGRRVVLPPSSR